MEIYGRDLMEFVLSVIFCLDWYLDGNYNEGVKRVYIRALKNLLESLCKAPPPPLPPPPLNNE